MMIIQPTGGKAVDRDSLRTDWLRAYHVATTKAAYARDIDAYFAWCDENGVDVLGARRKDVDAYLDGITGYSEATRCRKLSAVSSFYSYAMVEEEELVPRNPVERVRRPAVSSRSFTPFLDGRELPKLMAAADCSSVQDAALIRMLAYTGARVSELCGASTSNLRTELGERVLVVIRKGGIRCALDVPVAAAEALDRHLAGRTGPLFETRHGERMKPHQVSYRVKVLAREAGLDGKRLTPHGLRHTAATLAMRQCKDMRAVQEMLGHRQISTTSRYVHGKGGADLPGNALANSIEKELADA